MGSDGWIARKKLFLPDTLNVAVAFDVHTAESVKRETVKMPVSLGIYSSLLVEFLTSVSVLPEVVFVTTQLVEVLEYNESTDEAVMITVSFSKKSVPLKFTNGSEGEIWMVSEFDPMILPVASFTTRDAV